MNNKVKFLRGTATEYEASTKDNDVFYYVTDTKKLYLGANEVTGVGKTGTGENAEIFNNYESNEAYGIYSHAEGHMTHANDFSHAEGNGTQASGSTSHAEGANTVASGNQAHAEGMNTTASGYNSHAEGYMTIASNLVTHAGGTGSEASKEGSFVHGQVVKASSNNYEVAFGTFNKSNTDTLFSIGNGADEDTRRNAFEITKTTGKLFDKEIATKEDIPTTLPANGGNANTLGNIAPSGFLLAVASRKLTTSLNGSGLVGTFYCEERFTPDYPKDSSGNAYGQYGLLDVRVYGSIFYQTMMFENGIVIHRARIAGVGDWSSWQKLNDGGNAASVGVYTEEKIAALEARIAALEGK